VNVTLILAFVIGAPALKDKEKTPTIVGEWVIEQATVGGQPSPPGDRPNRWTFNADGQRFITGPGGQILAEGRYTTDSKTGTIDLDGDKPIDQGYPCRYKIEGDTLTLNVGWQKSPRPMNFECPMGSQSTLYVMKRVKPKE
jgi:uncharacterized protein (TIGR03067 family)